jgi:hypothetical protein
MSLLLCLILVLLIVYDVQGMGCGDLELVQQTCLASALSDTNEWHNCNYCLCEEMGGACNEQTFKDVLECEVKADPSNHELMCRLVLDEDWLIGFSCIAFVLGTIVSFLVYYYYMTADWTYLWESSCYVYLRSGQCFWDLITCKLLVSFLSCQWVFNIWESDFCNFFKTRLGFLCSREYWREACKPNENPQPMCPRWLLELCDEQPVFKPSSTSGYNPYQSSVLGLHNNTNKNGNMRV